MNIKNWILNGLLKRKGYQITSYPDAEMQRRFRIMDLCNINVVLDVGANRGFYAKELRSYRFKGKIISFEPLNEAFIELEKNANEDDLWFANKYALGDKEGRFQLNVANNLDSSSLSSMLPAHEESAPHAKFIGKEEIEVKTLDSIFNMKVDEEDRVMLKIDTQGYEKNIIDGAVESLKKVAILQMEMSLVKLYENDLLMPEMVNYLDELGFRLYSIESGFSNPKTGQTLQLDGIFVNRDLCEEIY